MLHTYSCYTCHYTKVSGHSSFFVAVVLFGILDCFFSNVTVSNILMWLMLTLEMLFCGKLSLSLKWKIQENCRPTKSKKNMCASAHMLTFNPSDISRVFSIFLYIFRLIERILDFWLQNLCVACRNLCKPTSLLKLQTFCNNCFCIFTYYLSLDLNYLYVVGYENCSKSHVFLKCVAIVRKN